MTTLLDLIIFYIYYFIESHKSSSIYFASGEVECEFPH